MTIPSPIFVFCIHKGTGKFQPAPHPPTPMTDRTLECGPLPRETRTANPTRTRNYTVESPTTTTSPTTEHTTPHHPNDRHRHEPRQHLPQYFRERLAILRTLLPGHTRWAKWPPNPVIEHARPLGTSPHWSCVFDGTTCAANPEPGVSVGLPAEHGQRNGDTHMLVPLARVPFLTFF